MDIFDSILLGIIQGLTEFLTGVFEWTLGNWKSPYWAMIPSQKTA